MQASDENRFDLSKAGLTYCARSLAGGTGQNHGMLMQESGERGEEVNDIGSFAEHGQTAGDANKCHNTNLVGNIFLISFMSTFLAKDIKEQKNKFSCFRVKRLEVCKNIKHTAPKPGFGEPQILFESLKDQFFMF